MFKHLHSRFLYVAIVAILHCANCCAQGDGPTVKIPTGLEDLVEGNELPAVYMYDENGRIRMIPQGTYNLFESWNNLRAKQSPPRDFDFDTVEIRGEVVDRIAKLNVKVRVIVQDSPEQVSIPIRMHNFHRVGPLKVEGLDATRVTFDPQQRSHVVSGKPSKSEIVIAGEVLVGVNSNPDASINLYLPAAQTDIEIAVPATSIVGRVVDSENEEIVHPPKALENGKTQIGFSTAGGDITIAWGQSEQPVAENQSLEVEGDWKINWEDSSIDVTLNVRSLSGRMTPFHVDLPSQYTLAESTELTPVDGGADTSVKRYLVSPLAESRAKLQFQVDYPRLEYQSKSPLLVTGIAVEGGIRQTGTISVRAARDNRFRWRSGQFVQPIASETAADSGIKTHRFRYQRNSFRLPIWMDAKSTRVRAQLNYDIAIDRDAVELSAALNLVGRGVTGRVLELQHANWSISPTADLAALEADGVEIHDDKVIVEIDEVSTLVAEDAEQRLIRIPLIQPRDSTNQSAATVQLPRMNLVGGQGVNNFVPVPGIITVSETRGQEIVFQRKTSRGVSPIVGQPSTFRLLSWDSNPIVDHTIIQSDRRVRQEMRVAFDLGLESGKLTQELDFSFQRGTLASLPVRTESPEEWNVTVDGKPASITGDADAGYAIQFSPLPAGQHRAVLTRDIVVPLKDVSICVPVSDDFDLTKPVPISLASADWRLTSSDEGQQTADVQLPASGILNLPLQRKSNTFSETLVISKCWVQTTAGTSRRRDRLIAQVTGSGNGEVRFVGDAMLESREILLQADGQLLRHTIRDGMIVATLPEGSDQCILDLQIWSASNTAAFRSLDPLVAPDHPTQETFWELVLPETQHLVGSSLSLGRSMRWNWDRWMLRRFPTHAPEELSSMFGIDIESQVAASNRYLFHTPAFPIGMSALVAMRPTIWILIGGITLVLSSGLVYMPGMRRPVTFIACGFAILVITTFSPDAAIICGQIGLLALTLTLLLLVLQRFVRVEPKDTVFREARRTNEGSTRSLVATIPDVASTRDIEHAKTGSAVEAS